MKNLNFMPRKYKEAFIYLKTKRYEGYVLILWFFCILLYFFYLYNINQIKKEMNSNLNKNLDTLSVNIKVEAGAVGSLEAFEEFMENLANSFNYKSISIEKNNIALELLVNDKKDYYKIVEQFESSPKYRIIKLSPINTDEGENTFQIAIEVKT